MCTLQGTVDKFFGIKFIKDKNGTDIGCKFILNVRRNYKNNGKYKYDQITVKYMGTERMAFIKNYIKPGIILVVVGSMTVEEWTKSNGQMQSNVVLGMETCHIVSMATNDCSLPV